jgi:transcriptional regulator with XRE-family HTH domain
MNSWKQVEKRRVLAGLSRAEMCRRAHVSETTAWKGLRARSKPSPLVLAKLEQVLTDAEQRTAS